tara:strand:+ start:495 stop:605 length:111 start_codon:yes stop_codon:yes gene_type:complete
VINDKNLNCIGLKKEQMAEINSGELPEWYNSQEKTY